MSEDWSAIANEVSEAIASIGDVNSPSNATVTFLTRGTQSGDAWNPVFAADGTDAAPALVSDYSDDDLDDTIIKRGDKQVLVSASDVTIVPSTKHRVRLHDLSEWNIIRVQTTSPAGVDVMYKVQIRS